MSKTVPISPTPLITANGRIESLYTFQHSPFDRILAYLKTLTHNEPGGFCFSGGSLLHFYAVPGVMNKRWAEPHLKSANVTPNTASQQRSVRLSSQPAIHPSVRRERVCRCWAYNELFGGREVLLQGLRCSAKATVSQKSVKCLWVET